MTGRKGRVVQTEDGQILYESRSEADVPLETLNLTEKQRFMDGQKDVAIISEAASSGISLQSDRRYVDLFVNSKLVMSVHVIHTMIFHTNYLKIRGVQCGFTTDDCTNCSYSANCLFKVLTFTRFTLTDVAG